jgi:hypothetical protein
LGIENYRIVEEQKRLPDGYTVIYQNNVNTQANARVNTDVEHTLLYRFMMGQYDGASYAIASPNFQFQTVNWVSTDLTAWPSTAIPLIKNTDKGYALFTVDPTTNIFCLCEEQMFESFPSDVNANTESKWKYFANIVEYITNASDYGLLFTRLLTDGEPLNLWSDQWGENVYPY